MPPLKDLQAFVEDGSDDDNVDTVAHSPTTAAAAAAAAPPKPKPQVYTIIPDNASIDSGYSSKTAATVASADHKKPDPSKKKPAVRIAEIKKDARPRSSSVDSRLKSAAPDQRANTAQPRPKPKSGHAQRPQLPPVSVQHHAAPLPHSSQSTPTSATSPCPCPTCMQAPPGYYYHSPTHTYQPMSRIPPSPTAAYGPASYMPAPAPLPPSGMPPPQPRPRGPSFTTRPLSYHEQVPYYPPPQSPMDARPPPPQQYAPAQHPSPIYDYPSGYPNQGPRGYAYPQPSPIEAAPQRPLLSHHHTDRSTAAGPPYQSAMINHLYGRAQTTVPSSSQGPFRPPPGRPPADPDRDYVSREAMDSMRMPPPGMSRRPSTSRRESVSRAARAPLYPADYASDYYEPRAAYEDDYDDYDEPQPAPAMHRRRPSTRVPSHEFARPVSHGPNGPSKTYSERRREMYRQQQPQDRFRDGYDDVMRAETRRQMQEAEVYQANRSGNPRDRATSDELTQEALRNRTRSQHGRSNSYSRSRTSSGESQEAGRQGDGFTVRVGENTLHVGSDEHGKQRVVITSDGKQYIREGSRRSAGSRHSRRGSAFGVDEDYLVSGVRGMSFQDRY